MGLLDQYPWDKHGEDVHLLLEFHLVNVAAYDDCLFRAGLRYLVKGEKQGGIQHLRPVKRNVLVSENRRAVIVGHVSVVAGRYLHAGKETGTERLPCFFRRRLIPADNGNVGISFCRWIGYHIVCNTASQGAFCDS